MWVLTGGRGCCSCGHGGVGGEGQPKNTLGVGGGHASICLEEVVVVYVEHCGGSKKSGGSSSKSSDKRAAD